MKFSGYCFCINTNIKGDFQICISVPLSLDILESTLIGLYLVFSAGLSFLGTTLVVLKHSGKIPMVTQLL